jgi:hypothetical protein
MIKLLKKAKQTNSSGEDKSNDLMPLSSLLSQLALGRAEWVKFLGGTDSSSDASAVERAALDQSTTVPALIDLVTAS